MGNQFFYHVSIISHLNRVESFYACLLRLRSEGSKEEGRPAAHGQAAAKASSQGTAARRDISPQGQRRRRRGKERAMTSF
ncbi:hypothetical protein BHM03_00048985 [Ensete ventricosum]|nr:hypothetical protein BHM03_00048985 [Ensete ventricosum]